MAERFVTAQASHRFMELSWRIYVFAIGLGFFVVVEPAPTDLVFFIALAFFCFAKPAKTRFLSGTALTGIFLYCFFSVLSLIFVEHVMILAIRAVVIEFYMMGLFALTAYFVATRGDRAFFTILLAFAVGAICASVVTAVALLDLVPNSEMFFRSGRGVRVQATFKDPNVFGPYLVPSLLFVTWLAIESRRFRLIALAALGMICMSLLSTYSRGAWIHAAISLAFLGTAMLIYRPTAFPALNGVVCFTIIVLATLLLFLDQITARISDSFLGQRLSLQSYDESRFAYVAEAAQRIWEHPFGIGPFQARYKYGYLPHNTWIAFAMHNGIFASLGLILIYGSSMARCIVKVLARRDGWLKYALILSVLLGLLVLTQVVGAIHWRHLYIVCGLAFGRYTSNRLLPEHFALGRRAIQRRPAPLQSRRPPGYGVGAE